MDRSLRSASGATKTCLGLTVVTLLMGVLDHSRVMVIPTHVLHSGRSQTSRLVAIRMHPYRRQPREVHLVAASGGIIVVIVAVMAQDGAISQPPIVEHAVDRSMLALRRQLAKARCKCI